MFSKETRTFCQYSKHWTNVDSSLMHFLKGFMVKSARNVLHDFHGKEYFLFTVRTVLSYPLLEHELEQFWDATADE